MLRDPKIDISLARKIHIALVLLIIGVLESVDWSVQGVATGMNYLHSMNPPLLHRDLKVFNASLELIINSCIVEWKYSGMIVKLW
jgi:hypothetical protein